MDDSQIRFPIRLRCDLNEVNLGSNVIIRAMMEEDRPPLLGIESATFNQDGRIKSYAVNAVYSPFDLAGPSLDHYDQLYSSNYVATVPSRQEAKNLNFAFKLLARSCTSLWIGTAGDLKRSGRSRHFLGPPCYYGSEPLSVESSDVETLSALLSACRGLKSDKKLAVMADIFLYAMSVAPRDESRCIELSIVLEMLLLPKASTELSYRFALRLAKLALTQLGEAGQDWFARGQQIYKTRSRLVHSGQDDKLALNAVLVEETARRLLALYVRKPSLFEEAALDSLCIA
jgi:Apea-like HEPN